MTFMFSTSCATNALCGALEVGEYANVGYLLLLWQAEGPERIDALTGRRSVCSLRLTR